MWYIWNNYKESRNLCRKSCLRRNKRLEYRGYDSWGIAALNGSLKIIKNIGKISAVSLDDLDFHPTNLAIGHTRWATHGSVNQINAHPHFSVCEKFALVQNGIVENFQELKEKLQSQGYQFNSDTDTEVIVHLIEKYYKGDILSAVQTTVKYLKGAYAIAVLSLDNPDVIIGTRFNAPLVVGLAEDNFFLASDLFFAFTSKNKSEARKKFLSELKEDDVMCYMVREIGRETCGERG